MKYVELKPVKTPNDIRPQMSTTVSYVNRTGVPLAVRGRDGVVSIVETDYTNVHKGMFYIVVTFWFTGKVSFNALASTHPDAAIDKKIILDAIAGAKEATGTKLSVTYELPYSELDDKGCVHLETFDITISKDIRNPMKPSPYTREAGLRTLESSCLSKLSLNYKIIIIDKYNQIGKRYIKIAGNTHEVPRVTSSGYPCGVYSCVNSGDSHNAVYHKLQECPLEMYESEEDAYKSVGSDLKLKEITASNKETITKLTKQLDDVNETLTRERVERTNMDDISKFYSTADKERRDAKRYTDELESTIARDNMRAKVEVNTVSNKAVIEWLKIIPPLVTVFTLILTLWKT